MEGPTVLVMNHIYNRYMSYKSGVMTCRLSVDGIPLGERLSTLQGYITDTLNLLYIAAHPSDRARGA